MKYAGNLWVPASTQTGDFLILDPLQTSKFQTIPCFHLLPTREKLITDLRACRGYLEGKTTKVAPKRQKAPFGTSV